VIVKTFNVTKEFEFPCLARRWRSQPNHPFIHFPNRWFNVAF